jgi:hypothetical protein
MTLFFKFRSESFTGHCSFCKTYTAGLQGQIKTSFYCCCLAILNTSKGNIFTVINTYNTPPHLRGSLTYNKTHFYMLYHIKVNLIDFIFVSLIVGTIFIFRLMMLNLFLQYI